MAWPPNMTVAPIREWPGATTARRTRSNFSARWSDTLELLSREMRQLNAKNAELLVAIPADQFRLDGYPRATAKAEHPGIIISFDSTVGHLSYPCDAFDRWEDNLRGVALALEALRKVDRYGVTKRGEQYRGFLALEATAMPSGLGFSTVDAAVDYLADVANVAFEDAVTGLKRTVARAKFRSHPDTRAVDVDENSYERVNAAEAFLKTAGRL